MIFIYFEIGSDGKGNFEMGELEVKTFKQVEELGKSNPQDSTPPKPESVGYFSFSFSFSFPSLSFSFHKFRFEKKNFF